MLKGIIEFLGVGQTDVLERVMDVGDLMRCEPDIAEGVEGRIEATDVEGCAKVVVELDKW